MGSTVARQGSASIVSRALCTVGRLGSRAKDILGAEGCLIWEKADAQGFVSCSTLSHLRSFGRAAHAAVLQSALSLTRAVYFCPLGGHPFKCLTWVIGKLRDS
jgi:hypothetical protein